MLSMMSPTMMLVLFVGALAAPSDHGELHDPVTVLEDVEAAFARWATAHSKPYINDVAEMGKRRGIFRDNALFVQQHNSNGAARSTLALNEFADLSFEEFRGSYLGYDPALAGARDGGANVAHLQVRSLRTASMHALAAPACM